LEKRFVFAEKFEEHLVLMLEARQDSEPLEIEVRLEKKEKNWSQEESNSLRELLQLLLGVLSHLHTSSSSVFLCGRVKKEKKGQMKEGG
jgi:hypothetical protein